MLLLFLFGSANAGAPTAIPGLDPKQVERDARKVCVQIKAPLQLATNLVEIANMVQAVEGVLEDHQIAINWALVEVGMVRVQTIVGHNRTYDAATAYDRALTDALLAIGEERRRLHGESARLLEESREWVYNPSLEHTPIPQMRAHCRTAFTQLQVNLAFTYGVVQGQQARLNVPRDLYRDAMYLENAPSY